MWTFWAEAESCSGNVSCRSSTLWECTLFASTGASRKITRSFRKNREELPDEQRRASRRMLRLQCVPAAADGAGHQSSGLGLCLWCWTRLLKSLGSFTVFTQSTNTTFSHLLLSFTGTSTGSSGNPESPSNNTQTTLFPGVFRRKKELKSRKAEGQAVFLDVGTAGEGGWKSCVKNASLIKHF